MCPIYARLRTTSFHLHNKEQQAKCLPQQLNIVQLTQPTNSVQAPVGVVVPFPLDMLYGAYNSLASLTKEGIESNSPAPSAHYKFSTPNSSHSHPPTPPPARTQLRIPP